MSTFQKDTRTFTCHSILKWHCVVTLCWWINDNLSNILCFVRLPSVLRRESAAVQSKVDLHVARSKGSRRPVYERFEFQYAKAMWCNVSKEQTASSCLPTQPFNVSHFRWMEISFSGVGEMVFWFDTCQNMKLGYTESVCGISNKHCLSR